MGPGACEVGRNQCAADGWDVHSLQEVGEIALRLSTNATTISLVIERLGSPKAKVFSKAGILGMEHPIPDRASSDGCQWPTGSISYWSLVSGR